MGKYINIGNAEFESVRKDEYVDKSMLIAYVNKVLGTQRKFLCVTRARRFGKSIAAKMLNAYYDESVNSHALFHDLNIAKDPSYEPHRNKYPVIYLDMTSFMTRRDVPTNRILDVINSELLAEIDRTYPGIDYQGSNDVLVHQNNTSILQYNDENALSYVVSLAYQAGQLYYHFVRELPTGKGFADIVMLPRIGVNKPAVVLELKYDQSANAAIDQIKTKGYAQSLREYAGEVVLVGINYDKKTKHHECIIERLDASIVQNDTQGAQNDTQGDTQGKLKGKALDAWILAQIRKNPKVSTERLAQSSGRGIATIKRHTAAMPNIRFQGSGYSGVWIIIEQ